MIVFINVPAFIEGFWFCLGVITAVVFAAGVVIIIVTVLWKLAKNEIETEGGEKKI